MNSNYMNLLKNRFNAKVTICPIPTASGSCSVASSATSGYSTASGYYASGVGNKRNLDTQEKNLDNLESLLAMFQPSINSIHDNKSFKDFCTHMQLQVGSAFSSEIVMFAKIIVAIAKGYRVSVQYNINSDILYLSNDKIEKDAVEYVPDVMHVFHTQSNLHINPVMSVGPNMISDALKNLYLETFGNDTDITNLESMLNFETTTIKLA